MSRITDEVLMAYADGELSAEEQQNVESLLRTSPEAVRRLGAFTTTGRDMARLFDEIVEAPVPQTLVDAVLDRRAEAQQAASVVYFPGARAARAGSGRSFGSVHKLAIAATLAALVIGAGAALFKELGAPAGSGMGVAVLSTGDKVAVQELGGVLDHVASGQSSTQRIGGGEVTIRPVFTFATHQDGYCRQYALSGGSIGSHVGVACRSAEGRWVVKKQVALEERGSRDGKIVPAAGDGTPEIEAVVDGLISGDVLDVTDEKTLIDRGWVTP
jgi:hypothetical protein